MEIETLADQQAIRVLALVADHDAAVPDPAQLRELDERLREAVEDPELAGHATADGEVSDGELARAALAHLATTPEHAETVRRAIGIAVGDTSRFIEPATLAIGGLVLVALQTEVELTRTSTGRWRLRVHKTAMSDSTLGKVLGKAGRLLPPVHRLTRTGRDLIVGDTGQNVIREIGEDSPSYIHRGPQ